jgi:RNA polymerase sigma factor (sigma-70 family)
VHHPSFSLPATAERLWGPQCDEIHVEDYSLQPAVGQPGAPRPARTALSRERERTLFLRYNYAKYRLRKLADGAASASRDREMAVWGRRAKAAREKIIHANLPLVPAMANRRRIDGVEFADKVSEGYMAVLRAVEHFDVSRGCKFSTYACRAILAALYRLGSKSQTYRRHVPFQFDPAYEKDDYRDRRHARQRADAIESVRRVLRRNEAGLTEAEAEVTYQRYPVGGGTPRPLWKVGRSLGVSTERVRQIEKASLRKLGPALERALTA